MTGWGVLFLGIFGNVNRGEVFYLENGLFQKKLSRYAVGIFTYCLDLFYSTPPSLSGKYSATHCKPAAFPSPMPA